MPKNNGDKQATELTHLTPKGKVRMVDISAKSVTRRTAIAVADVRCGPVTVDLLRRGELAKGDALATARIAAIAAAKRTPDLIPLCHPVAITGVDITATIIDSGVRLRAQVRTADRTGIEMEALTAVSVGALTVIDMVKGVDRQAYITDIHVELKEGGASGTWQRDGAASTEVPSGEHEVKHTPQPLQASRPVRVSRSWRACIVTVSDRRARGEQLDRSGPFLVQAMEDWGATVRSRTVPDDAASIARAIREEIERGTDVVITSGGTGITTRDVTPEAVVALLDKSLPGIEDAIRARGHGVAPGALLSRTVAGVAGRTFVLTLPGSPGAARDGILVLEPIVEHLLDQLADSDHEEPL